MTTKSEEHPFAAYIKDGELDCRQCAYDNGRCPPHTNFDKMCSGFAPFDPPIEKLTEAKGINPKEIAGSKKPSTWSVMPRWVTLAVGRVMSVGAAKYGAFNYRETNISASVYQDAMERHLQLWFDGEDDDPETGVSHLASVIASCSLLMDAQMTGKLHDDRQKTGFVRKYLDQLQDLLTTLPLPKPQTGE